MRIAGFRFICGLYGKIPAYAEIEGLSHIITSETIFAFFFWNPTRNDMMNLLQIFIRMLNSRDNVGNNFAI